VDLEPSSISRVTGEGRYPFERAPAFSAPPGSLLPGAALPTGDNEKPQPLLDFRAILAKRDALVLILGEDAIDIPDQPPSTSLAHSRRDAL
jgi:hypothetical protein